MIVRTATLADRPPHGAMLALAAALLIGAPAALCAPSVGEDGPVGGPGGYVAPPLLNDSFGSAKPGANITSLSQFNPSTPYGPSGIGWDRYMKGWSERGPCN